MRRLAFRVKHSFRIFSHLYLYKGGRLSIMKTVQTICTTPPGCHNGCGIIALVDNGRVTEIHGDPSNPFNRGSLCPRGAALPATVYHPDRQLYPLKKTKSGWRKRLLDYYNNIILFVIISFSVLNM